MSLNSEAETFGIMDPLSVRWYPAAFDVGRGPWPRNEQGGPEV